MLEDIENNSPLRRGHPAAHMLYGAAQTINAANYLFVEALNTVRLHLRPGCLEVYAEELHRLHVGQSFDLHWTNQVTCPSILEYIEMIDNSKSKEPTATSDIGLPRFQRPEDYSVWCPECWRFNQM
jgi:geranylgeranyl pyrophosphate synthase